MKVFQKPRHKPSWVGKNVECRFCSGAWTLEQSDVSLIRSNQVEYKDHYSEVPLAKTVLYIMCPNCGIEELEINEN